LIAEGVWEGEVIRELRGNGGFGYNPLFLDPDRGLTAAEMDAALKNRLSHRARALDVLNQQLTALFAHA
ncbi:MAG: non-canonical purine NTP pyrophosphatase, partial [Stenotrophomonas chelatiphaga]